MVVAKWILVLCGMRTGFTSACHEDKGNRESWVNASHAPKRLKNVVSCFSAFQMSVEYQQRLFGDSEAI